MKKKNLCSMLHVGKETDCQNDQLDTLLIPLIIRGSKVCSMPNEGWWGGNLGGGGQSEKR